MSGEARAMRAARTHIGKYRLIAELGQGGMAEVFLGLVRGPAGFNRLVVLKILRSMLANDPDLRTMFLDEARLTARFNHVNVVQIHEVGDSDENYFITMEFLEGQTLASILNA